MQEYRRKFDALSSEERWLRSPGRARFVLSEIGRGKVVLDVGCLGGRLSERILRQNNEVWGLELNPAAAREAAQRGIRVTEGNAEEGLPFESAFFDVVHAGEVLAYLYDTKSFFEECARVLKADGMLLLTTANLNSLRNRLRVLRGGYLAGLGAYPEDHHGDQVRVFNLPKLRELCEAAGFGIDKARGGSPEGGLSSVATVWLPSLSETLMIRASKRAN